MIRLNHEDVWYWYLTIQDRRASEMNESKYCAKHNIDYKKFINRKYRIEYKKHSNPKLYERYVDIGRRYRVSGETTAVFAKANNIKSSILSEVNTHINYLEIVEMLKKKHNHPEESMGFIKVPALAHEPIAQTEVIEKKNDLELIISKGVKVIISPDLPTDKLIKIIELLKDL